MQSLPLLTYNDNKSKFELEVKNMGYGRGDDNLWLQQQLDDDRAFRKPRKVVKKKKTKPKREAKKK